MKVGLLMFVLLAQYFAQGQHAITKPTQALCRDSTPNRESLIVCAESKVYDFSQFRASLKEGILFIHGSKPDEQHIFPIFQLFVHSNKKTGVYDSKTGKTDIYGTFTKGGQTSFNSQAHHGSCSVSLVELTESHVKGTVTMTAYDQFGSSAMSLTGSFFIKFKKE